MAQLARDQGHVTAQQLQQMILDIAAATRRLVRSQNTWFRDDNMFLWVDAKEVRCWPWTPPACALLWPPANWQQSKLACLLCRAATRW